MDDRFDQILISSNLLNGVGLDYRGNAAAPYSTTTWNDPNHSYRVWGNDGGSFNTSLRTTGNEMVGPDIAGALIRSAQSGGHLPVFLDLNFAAVPEPGTVALLVTGLPSLAFVVIRRRGKRTKAQ